MLNNETLKLFNKVYPKSRLIIYSDESGHIETNKRGTWVDIQIAFWSFESLKMHLTTCAADLRRRRSPKVKRVSGASR